MWGFQQMILRSEAWEAFSAEDARGAQRTPGMTENEIGHVIITAAMTVHSAIGPGLLESARMVNGL